MVSLESNYAAASTISRSYLGDSAADNSAPIVVDGFELEGLVRLSFLPG